MPMLPRRLSKRPGSMMHRKATGPCLAAHAPANAIKRSKSSGRQFQTRIKTFTVWLAQIIQHKIDHCNGILI